MNHPATHPLQCRLSRHERFELGWSEVSHCSKCDHAVFLAKTQADATALSMLGQCVKFMREYVPEPIFVGCIEWDPLTHGSVALRIALPAADAAGRKRALDGARLYLNRMPEFERMLECLERGEVVYTPLMQREEASALQIRFSEWSLVVSVAHAA